MHILDKVVIRAAENAVSQISHAFPSWDWQGVSRTWEGDEESFRAIKLHVYANHWGLLEANWFEKIRHSRGKNF